MNVAIVQMRPERYNVEKNLKKMQGYIEKAGNKAAEYIIFPELITSGYECGERFVDLAEPVDQSISINYMKKLAEKHGVHIIFGFPELDSDDQQTVYNSVALIDDVGILKGIYRKAHLFGSEKQYFRPGNEYPVFDTKYGKIAMMICWDTAFPEVARIYALKGAKAIFISTNWENPYSDDWDLAVRSRAADNTVYIAAANRVGTDEQFSFFGHSKIVGPTGKVIQSMDYDKEGMMIQELDLKQIDQMRKEYYSYFEDRRPDTYGDLLKLEKRSVFDDI